MTLSSDNRSEELPCSERNPASTACLVAVMSDGSEPQRKCNEGAVDLKSALSIEWRYTAASICGGTMGILCGAERLKSVCSRRSSSAQLSYERCPPDHMMNADAFRPLSSCSKWLSVRHKDFLRNYKHQTCHVEEKNTSIMCVLKCVFINPDSCALCANAFCIIFCSSLLQSVCVSHTNCACSFLTCIIRLSILSSRAAWWIVIMISASLDLLSTIAWNVFPLAIYSEIVSF